MVGGEKKSVEINISKYCSGEWRREQQNSRAAAGILHLLLRVDHFEGYLAVHGLVVLLKRYANVLG